MDVLETIKKRFSCRRYKSGPVPEEKLNRVLESARLAPSAHNSQDWKFIVVKNPQIRKKLALASGQPFISQAPVIIAAVSLEPEHILSSDNPAGVINLAIAVDHMTLAATAEGLATCWIGAFSQEEVKEILKIPPRCQVISLLPLGFPADLPKPKDRKSLQEIVSYESF